MCDIVTVGDVEYRTFGELRTIMEPVIYAYYPPDRPVRDEWCLCCVNLPKTLKDAGYSYTANAWGYDAEKMSTAGGAP